MNFFKKIRHLFSKNKRDKEAWKGQLLYQYKKGFDEGRVYERTMVKKKNKALRNSLNPQMKKDILNRDNNECFYCKKSLWFEDATIDHKIPISLGGTNSIENLVACCLGCNKNKGNFIVMGYAQDTP